MAKIFENSQLVNKLAFDDIECAYVNRMMEMPADFLRDLHRKGECYDNMHGVVPTCKLPTGYYFGNFGNNTSDQIKSDKNDRNIISNSKTQDSLKSAVKMETDDKEIDKNDDKDIMIQTVRDDLILSDDDDDEEEIDNSTPCTNSVDCTEDNGKLLFDTLSACSKMIPNVSSLDKFKKHYRTEKPARSTQKAENPSEKTTENKNTTAQNDCKQSIHDLLKLISVGTYKKNLASSFQNICNIISKNKRKLSPPLKSLGDGATPPKVSKVMSSKPIKEEMTKDKKTEDQEVSFIQRSLTDVCELHIRVLPKIIESMKPETLKRIMEGPKANTRGTSSVKPKYETQDSLPFKTDSVPAKNTKVTDIISVTPTISTTTLATTAESITANTPSVAAKKPEATAKQFYVKPTNYSTYNATSNAKVAVVTGKVNETKSAWQHSHANSDCDTKSQTGQFQRSSQSSASQAYNKDSNNDNDADEAKVVEGLLAMNRMRTYFKNDFIARMKHLDIEKWLKEVRSLKEKAVRSKGQLDFAPHIMVFIRKNLFYNYSLEVKSDFAKSHHTYLENAAIIKQSCAEINQIYSEHEKNILDKGNARLWNINLVKHFTVTMCHHISAILQYRAFRNVADDCRKIYQTLVRLGVIDKTDHRGNSPTSSCSPRQQPSTRTSPPRISPSTRNNSVTLTPEVRSMLQRYIDHTNIINAGYNDWLLAEQSHAKYCQRSSRHEEAWRDFEWRIVERTGGVALSSIDEPVPFVIKYLEGYINYMYEFMKRHV